MDSHVPLRLASRAPWLHHRPASMGSDSAASSFVHCELFLKALLQHRCVYVAHVSSHEQTLALVCVSVCVMVSVHSEALRRDVLVRRIVSQRGET